MDLKEIAKERKKRQKYWMTERKGKRGEVCIEKTLKTIERKSDKGQTHGTVH
jgi:hypothetical protein